MLRSNCSSLLQRYAPAWHEVDPVTGAPKGVSAALIGLSARFAEVLIQRLNQVPQKNFLAFLDLFRRRLAATATGQSAGDIPAPPRAALWMRWFLPEPRSPRRPPQGERPGHLRDGE